MLPAVLDILLRYILVLDRFVHCLCAQHTGLRAIEESYDEKHRRDHDQGSEAHGTVRTVRNHKQKALPVDGSTGDIHVLPVVFRKARIILAIGIR